MNVFWEREIKVTWDNTDKSGNLSLPGMGQLLINTAEEHAEALGFGYRQLKHQNMNWVLVTMNFEINRFPVWDEKIKLITWPSGVKSILGLREFIIKDEQNNNLVKASSEWMIIDLERRRPKRLSQFEGILQYANTEKVLEKEPLKANAEGLFTDLFKIKIRHSSLDFNGHATAKKYFDWINDAMYQAHGDKEIERFQVKFFNESYLDETIILQIDDKQTSFRGIKENGKIAFMAAVDFKDKNK